MSLVIANYNPEWPRLFEREAADVLASVDGIDEVEHVGSTAVPSMSAVPTIDLLAGADDPNTVDDAALVRLGYTEADAVRDREPERRLFWKGSEAYQTYHLHLVPLGGVLWERTLAFRDRLRDDRDLAERYAHHRRRIADQYAEDPDAYAEAKAAFIGTVLQAEAEG